MYKIQRKSVNKTIILNFCKKNGINCQEFIIDDGFSGRNLNRPGIKRISEEKKYKVILVKDFSRFSLDYIETRNFIKENKIILLSIMNISFWR